MKITLKDGSVLEVEQGLTAGEVAKTISEGLARVAVCARINGELCDLSTKIEEDCELQIITLKDKEGLDVLRHTCSHVLAQAVKNIFPTSKLAIGPTVENGFYYDIDFKTPITQQDLVKIEEEMKAIIKSDFPIERYVYSKKDALKIMKDFGYDYYTSGANGKYVMMTFKPFKQPSTQP
jgi:threonyl-tRNA synthetase